MQRTVQVWMALIVLVVGAACLALRAAPPGNPPSPDTAPAASRPAAPATAPAPPAPDLSGRWVMTLHGGGRWYIKITRQGDNRFALSGGSATIAGDYELHADRLSKAAPVGTPSPCEWRLTDQGTLELLTTKGIMHAGDTMTRNPARNP